MQTFVCIYCIIIAQQRGQINYNILMSSILSSLPLTIEFIEKIALIQPLVYPAALLVGAILDSANLGVGQTFERIKDEIFGGNIYGLFLMFYMFPNFITVPLMALETYGLPLIAKMDQIVQIIDMMNSLLLLIIPFVQLCFALINLYQDGFYYLFFQSFDYYYQLANIQVFSNYAMVYLIAIDIITQYSLLIQIRYRVIIGLKLPKSTRRASGEQILKLNQNLE